MATISFDLSDDALLSMHSPLAEVEHQIRMAAAVKLYELGRLSSGAAARLAGVPRVAFLARLGDYGVDTFGLTEDELLADVHNACGAKPGVVTSATGKRVVVKKPDEPGK